MKLYQYTIYKQDGTIEELEPCGKKDFKQLREILRCTIIQTLPKDYLYEHMDKRATYYLDDEGRYVSDNSYNPHFRVLVYPLWDVMGDVVQEAVWHESTVT